MRPKDIGTAFETAVVAYLRVNGFAQAERRALAGTHDLGDITGTPGIAWECKAGVAAKTAGDGVVSNWLFDTERERQAAGAEVGVLVLDRAGFGAKRAGEWWAILAPGLLAPQLLGPRWALIGARPVRLHLVSVVVLLRAAGFGDQLASLGPATLS